MPFRKQYQDDVGLKSDPYLTNPEKRIQEILAMGRKPLLSGIAKKGKKIWSAHLGSIYRKKTKLPKSQAKCDDFIVKLIWKISCALSPRKKDKPFGVAQKIVNLFFKDLWAFGHISAPIDSFLHIPIDRGVLGKLKKAPSTWSAWTKATATRISSPTVKDYLEIQKLYRAFLAHPAAPGTHPRILKTAIEMDQFLWHRIKEKIMKGQKMAICLTLTPKISFIKITFKCGARKNLGVIEKNGTLNIKPILKEMLVAAGAKKPSTASFTAAKKGTTRGAAGSGYHSYYKFRSEQEAIKYLKRWFTMINCQGEKE